MTDPSEFESPRTGDRSVAQRILATLRADPDAYVEVGSDASDDRTTALMVGLVGLTAGLLNAGLFLPRSVLGTLGSDAGLFDQLLNGVRGVVAAYVAWLVGTWLFFKLGRLLGGSSDYKTLLRGNAYASLAMAVSPIPIVGWALGLWSVYLFVVNVRANMSLSTGRSVLVVLPLTGFVYFALSFVQLASFLYLTTFL